MKKVIILIIIILSLIATYLLVKSTQDIEKILSQFNNVETDGFYDTKTNSEASGYIVSNKTTDGYRYGYVNYKGRILLKPEYNQLYRVMDIQDKDEVYIIAAKNGRYGVSLNGKTVIEYEYQFIEYDKTTQKFILQKSNKYGVANIDGEIVIPVENDKLEAKGIYFYVTKQDENKVYDQNGKIKQLNFNETIMPTKNEEYYIKMLEENGQYLYGVVDKEEKELVPAMYSYIEYILDDYFIACSQDGMQGVIDKNNNQKMQLRNIMVQKIQDTNILMVLDTQNNKIELYSNQIERICTMENSTIERESEDLIKIYNKEETRYFNNNGIEIKE